MVDLKREALLRQAIERFYFAYRAFTARPDRILEARGLGRVHHRILYFVGRHPAIAVSGLLRILGISKQALNAPLRQLLEMDLVQSAVSREDRRIRELALTAAGARLEAQLTGTQMRHLGAVFGRTGEGAVEAWMALMAELATEHPDATPLAAVPLDLSPGGSEPPSGQDRPHGDGAGPRARSGYAATRRRARPAEG